MADGSFFQNAALQELRVEGKNTINARTSDRQRNSLTIVSRGLFVDRRDFGTPCGIVIVVVRKRELHRERKVSDFEDVCQTGSDFVP